MSTPQILTILGSTGSIGCSTLDVVSRHPAQFEVFALTGYSRMSVLAEQCLQFQPRYAVVPSDSAAAALRGAIAPGGRCPTEILVGAAALEEVSAADPVTMVMASIVGAAGLAPTLAAARAGKRVLLANKEALVMAGGLFMHSCRDGGGTILPVDSEHNAIFQCLPATQADRVSRALPRSVDAVDERSVQRIILTASGGPFRQWSMEQMEQVTPDQACAHPNWSMGRKISVDSATLMNKGLELIEAHYLFDMPASGLDVVVHPQSIIHSLVEYNDGSTLAQMGNPDMRTPIAYSMAYPARMQSGVAPLSLAEVARLDFELPDPARFPCLKLATEALDLTVGPCVLNAANEVAVQAFLDETIGFPGIARVNRAVLESLGARPAPESIEAVMALDEEARHFARQHLSQSGARTLC